MITLTYHYHYGGLVVRIAVLCLRFTHLSTWKYYAKLHENAHLKWKITKNFWEGGPDSSPTGEVDNPTRALTPLAPSARRRSCLGQLPRMSSDPRNAPAFLLWPDAEKIDLLLLLLIFLYFEMGMV